MKKYLILLLLFLLIGCQKPKEQITNTNLNEIKEEDIIPPEPQYKDENPVVVGLYKNKKLVKEIDNVLRNENDTITLNIYFTNEDTINNSFNTYASNYENSSQYKIGFIIKFQTEDETINKIIKSPKDMYALSPYIFNYLYDDIHQQEGTWYSHLEEKDINENTIYSSIKLYATDKINKITTPITVTVFTYDTEDDFDNNGLYRGNSQYTITLKR